MKTLTAETTDIVTLIGTHTERGYLVYVQEGSIETDAVVDIEDPLLALYVPVEQIETGNSLAWLTLEQINAPHVAIEIPAEPKLYKERIGALSGVSEPS